MPGLIIAKSVNQVEICASKHLFIKIKCGFKKTKASFFKHKHYICFVFLVKTRSSSLVVSTRTDVPANKQNIYLLKMSQVNYPTSCGDFWTECCPPQGQSQRWSLDLPSKPLGLQVGGKKSDEFSQTKIFLQHSYRLL